MTALVPHSLGSGVLAVWSDASHGDLRSPTQGDDAPLVVAMAALTREAGPRRVHWVEQMHGGEVAVVTDTGVGEPGRASMHCAGRADALVASSPTTGLAVFVADCAPIALGSPEGVFAAVHAGWRGVCAGVVEHAVGTMRELGASSVTAKRGPCIRACCYEFSDADLEVVAGRYGPAVRARTRGGAPALDLPAAVSAALAVAGASEHRGVDECTGCGGGYFSHRVRGDTGRQALVVWRAAAAEGG